MIEAVKKTGYPVDFILSETEIESLILSAFSRNETLTDCIISKDCDGEFRIDADDDKLEAKLYLKKGRGRGKQLDLNELGKMIRSAGFVKLELDRIKADILSFYRSPGFVLDGYSLVKGVKPEPADDRTLEIEVEYLSEKKKQELLDQVAGSPVDTGDDFPLEAVTGVSAVTKEQRIAFITETGTGKPGRTVYGKEIPGLPGKEPVILLFGELRREKSEIMAAADGLLEIGKREGDGQNAAVLMRVRRHRDALISVTVAEDAMEAFITLAGHEGTGRELLPEDLEKAVEAAGVVKGLDTGSLSEALLKAKSGHVVEHLRFASGRKPKDGSESRLKFRIELNQEKDVTIRNDGRADFRAQSHFTSVSESDLIAEILPPVVLPQDGWDVRGNTISAKPPQPLRVQIGKNITQRAGDEGKIQLVAAVTGELIYAKGLLEIRNVHVVPGDVDFKSGNIRFPGSVFIKGSVQPGFHILAGNDILVEQVVDAALLSADGNILVKLGVKGGGKGVLRTKKNISAGFIERAVLLGVGDIKIEKSCVQSQVKCNGRVIMGQERSNLIGGITRARKGVTAFNLGTENGVRTEISFGQDYLIADQIELEEKEVDKLKKQITQIDIVMQKQTNDRILLEKIRAEKLKLLKVMEKRSFRLFTLRERFEEHFPSEISVTGTIYPGVILESHGRYHEVMTEKKNIKFSFDAATGRILEEAIKNRPA